MDVPRITTRITRIMSSVLILDTVKGHIWYSGDIRRGITYQGKLKVGEKVPERIVVKER